MDPRPRYGIRDIILDGICSRLNNVSLIYIEAAEKKIRQTSLIICSWLFHYHRLNLGQFAPKPYNILGFIESNLDIFCHFYYFLLIVPWA